MSLNEIYHDRSDDSKKNWQNYRINDINIARDFNIDTTGASPGDILQLNGSLDYTWVPFSSIVTQPLDHCSATLSTPAVSVNGNQLQFSGLTGSPIFSLNGSGQILVSQRCSLLVFLNITSQPNSNSMPLFVLSKYTPASDVILCEMSPYFNGTNSVYCSCNCIVPVQCEANDRIFLAGYLIPPSNQNCSVIIDECSIDILRLN